MTDSTDDAWERVEVTYLGRRWSDSSHAVYHVFDDGTDDAAWFKGAVMPLPIIGGVYSVERKGTSFRIKAGEFVRLSGSDEVDAWRLADRAALTRQEKHRAAKRLHAENGDLSGLTLGELRALMARQLAHQRAGTLAAVLAFLDTRA